MNLFIFGSRYKGRMLKTIIIDDEAHVRQTLEKTITKYCTNIELVAMADCVESGVETIRKFNPDLILLDIQLPDGTGFDILKKLVPVDFKVIFITAYDKYAIQAFKFSAIDYLLKPIDPYDLRDAINRAEKMHQNNFDTQLKNFQESIENTSDTNKKKIILKTQENIHLVKVRDINFCESDSSYTIVHLLDGKKIMVSNTLKEYDELLHNHGFFRVHKSYLINVSHIKRFEKAEGGYVVLENGNKIPVASRKRADLLAMFERLTD